MAEEEKDEEVLDKKAQKKKEKEAKKAAKEAAKAAKKGESFDGYATDGGAMYADADDDDEDEGFSASILLIIIFIVLIWLAILGLLIKLDIGGFGSGVLYPVLKDVPVINKILPDVEEDEATEAQFETLPDAIAEINRLNEEIKRLEENQAQSDSEGDSEEVKALKEEITRLRTFEDSQVEFEKLKTEFYEEVVFSENAPDIENYKAYYEEIDPDNAEYLYKQVIQQIEIDKEMEDYVQAYTDMKPKQAAAIFEQMTDNLDLVAEILENMDPDPRAAILGVMDSTVASQLTKIMDPD